MFRSVDGGVYYINAPGPGLLLVPAYLVDQNFEPDGSAGKSKLAIIVFWQFLGALLVYEMVASVVGEVIGPIVRRSSPRSRSASAVPFLFYTFQIYPELPGGFFLLFAFRKLVLDPGADRPRNVLAVAATRARGASVAAPEILGRRGGLGVWTGWKLLRTTPGGIKHHPYKLVLLGGPLAVSAYSIFLYNHALTGSLSPTATFSAAERSSFEPWNFFKGFSGLLSIRRTVCSSLRRSTSSPSLGCTGVLPRAPQRRCRRSVHARPRCPTSSSSRRFRTGPARSARWAATS